MHKAQITIATVEHVARIARLTLTEQEKERFVQELGEILNAFSNLASVDTKGIAPSFHPVSLQEHTRDDSIHPSLPQETALKNTIHTQDGYFKGPKIL